MDGSFIGQGELMKRSRCSIAVAAGLVALMCSVPATLADYERGLSAFKSGKYAEAAAEFQALVDQSPSYAFGYYMLGLSFFKMGKLNEAAENIKASIEIDGGRFERHHALANVYHAKKDHMKALKVLNEAEGLVDTDTKAIRFHSLRGFVNAELDKWSDAVEDLEKARDVESTPEVLSYLGVAYYNLGHHDKAAPVLRQTVSNDPGNASAHLFLAESLLNLAREASGESKKKELYTEGLRIAKKYRAMSPDDYRAENLVGKAALGAGDYKAAEEAFRRVLNLEPGYCYAMVNLGKSYIAEERWERAESALRRAAECAPRMAVIHDSLGFALQKQGRLEDSLQAYRRAYQIEPSSSVKERMGIVEQNIRIRAENRRIEEEKRKQEEEARQAEEEYQKALEKQQEWEKKRDG